MTPTEMIAVLQAFERGEAIESIALYGKDVWRTDPDPSWDFRSNVFRVKAVNYSDPQPESALRDKFAMAAMNGLLASCSGMGGNTLAEDAYAIADAMLAERGKP